MRTALILTLALLPLLGPAQTNPPAAIEPNPVPVAKLTRAQQTAAELQKTVDQLTQSNRDLLDLLKKQQAVLEDIQFDRRLQSRQIASLEERLEDTLLDNTRLQSKVAKLEEDAALRPAGSAPPAAPGVAGVPIPVAASTNSAPSDAETPALAPGSFLPQPQTQGEPGTMWWHRLLTLKGDDTRQSDLFQVQSKTWRVLWHNQDRAGKEFANTSALFINAFPKDDTIPYKVCAKLGSGGDSTELVGSGTYYLKIEASGGTWELAVEEYR